MNDKLRRAHEACPCNGADSPLSGMDESCCSVPYARCSCCHQASVREAFLGIAPCKWRGHAAIDAIPELKIREYPRPDFHVEPEEPEPVKDGEVEEAHQALENALIVIADAYGFDRQRKLLLLSMLDKLASLARRGRRHGCRHGWRGFPPEDGDTIQTPCLECGTKSLFIGTGGHLTCANVPASHGGYQGCPNPSFDDQIAALKIRCSPLSEEALRTALSDLIKSAKAYMHYHTEKFYDSQLAPTGLWPAIKKAESALAEGKKR